MLLPSGATVAVADGKKFSLFRNTGDALNPTLAAMPHPEIEIVNIGSGASHQNNAGNPDNGQAEEDGFAGGIAEFLNKRVLGGEISDLVIIAAPRFRRTAKELSQAAVRSPSRRDFEGSHGSHCE